MRSRQRPSVIVPVYNEAALLPLTLPAILREAHAIGADLVVVCNGCTDDSAALARGLAGSRARVVELDTAGKARAIRAGEALAPGFPRFYVDADIVLGNGCLGFLAETLNRGAADLVAPRLDLDLREGSRAAKAVSTVWGALPHMVQAGFHNVLGLSRVGRAAWGVFPDVIADDMFIESAVRPHRRLIDRRAAATILPPRTLRAWIAVRRRWAAGQRQLSAFGIRAPRTSGQSAALLRMMTMRRMACGALLYSAVRLGAAIPRPAGNDAAWYHDQTTRRR